MTSKLDNVNRFGVPADSMVFARGVRKNFGPLEVLKGIDFDVPAGSVACIIGPSGSGKHVPALHQPSRTAERRHPAR